MPQTGTPSRPLRQCELAVIGLAMALAALLTGFRIGHESLWLDEAFSVSIVAQPWSGLWAFLKSQEANMSAYHVLLKLWTSLGHSEAHVRALSALFAVATLPVHYLTARRLCGPRVAAVAVLLLATNLYFIRYAQEARAYELVCLLSALSAWLLLRAQESPTWTRWIVYALSGALLIHSHILGALILLAHAAWIVCLKPRSMWTRAALGYVCLLALSAPLLSFFLHHRNAGIVSWVPRPSVHGALVVFHDLTGMFAMTALYCIGAARAVHRLLRPRLCSRQGIATAILWFALPLVALLAESMLLRPLFLPQYLIGTLPALTIWVASGLADLVRRWPRRLAIAWLAACAISLGYWYGLPQKADWRAAAAELVAHHQPGDGLLVMPPYLRPPIDYALQRMDGAAGLVPVFPPIPWGRACQWAYFEKAVIRDSLETEQLAGVGLRRLWLLSPRGIHTADPRLPGLRQALKERGYHATRWSFYQVDLELLER
jgi:uncharacterized membrane protein